MSGSRFGRLQKSMALVPLALLSAAWTVNVTGLTHTTAAASDRQPVAPPDGTTIPSHAISAPASISSPSSGDPRRFASGIVTTATASGIPAAALAAYQRAANVIDAADPTCHLPWQLIAAIGLVESDHGRAEGNTLTPQGTSTPGIFGPPLDGRRVDGRRVALIRDTDGGRYDGDTRWDRAVGPMQFIPSTWAMVGVDADGDGQRNPQDVNDATLATAVYLCAGTEDLSTTAGQRVAVFRYNHSRSYVTAVLGVAAAYLAGDYASVPNSVVSSDQVFVPTATSHHPSRSHHAHASGTGHTHHPSGSPHPSPSQPTNNDSTPTNTAPSSKGPGTTATSAPAPTKPTEPAAPVLASAAQLANVCTSALKSTYGAAPDKAVQACVDQLTGKTLTQAQNAVGGVVASLADLVSGLLGGLGGPLLGGS